MSTDVTNINILDALESMIGWAESYYKHIRDKEWNDMILNPLEEDITTATEVLRLNTDMDVPDERFNRDVEYLLECMEYCNKENWKQAIRDRLRTIIARAEHRGRCKEHTASYIYTSTKKN